MAVCHIGRKCMLSHGKAMKGLYESSYLFLKPGLGHGVSSFVVPSYVCQAVT